MKLVEENFGPFCDVDKESFSQELGLRAIHDKLRFFEGVV